MRAPSVDTVSLPLSLGFFSFNNPIGACDACDGLGVKPTFTVEKMVPNPKVSIAAGAIQGWDKNTAYYAQLVALSEAHGFDLQAPFEQLDSAHQQIILYGAKDQPLKYAYRNTKGRMRQRSGVFEGVIPMWERRYKETESALVREHASQFLTIAPCDGCQGERLGVAARHVYVGERRLPEVVSCSIAETIDFVQTLSLTGWRAEVAAGILREITARLSFLIEVGLSYLTLHRSAETLSGGEAQRIRLASQIGSGLMGVMYVLDEPSIGLHQRDNERLLNTLFRLRDLGNTVIVVEHDEEAIRRADYVIDMGPRAGVHGGQVVACGRPEAVMQSPDSLTAQYLNGAMRCGVLDARLPIDANWPFLRLTGVSCHNVLAADVAIPLGAVVCVTGVSGSGKSSIVNGVLYPLLAQRLMRSQQSLQGRYVSLQGLEALDKVIAIDQSPIGRTPRSNPATYTGILTPIREIFAKTPEARARGYTPSRFSFNVKGGRCEACEGDGVTRVEMHFLSDVYVTCDVCAGQRYNQNTLEIRYKGKNIYEILNFTVEDALVFFDAVPSVRRKLQTLMDVGLSYLTLGQRATTLSGGEAQRVKLARELAKRDTGKTCYILDEPTTGLHFEDVRQLLTVLFRLREAGNTLLIIEHHMDVIQSADWIIDLGPEGGSGGGQIVAEGTPEVVAGVKASHTGRFLQEIFAKEIQSTTGE